MPQILETKDFVVDGHERAHHSRENGGHIVIWPKQQFAHQSDMPLKLAQDFMLLSMIVGEAFMTIMQNSGLDVARINYMNNGNWAYKKQPIDPKTHLSLYVRTWGEKHPRNDSRFQAFPDALTFPDRATGYYEGFQPLTEEECIAIRDEIVRLSGTDKYAGLDIL
jgi:diadenosine tetraphosphate (Ap4A) HIT family hydrolase